MSEGAVVSKVLKILKSLNASLRLKDVLETTAEQFSDLGRIAKVAIFLSDNDSLSLKLMASRGYSKATCEELQVVPFSCDSILKQVVQKRVTAQATDLLKAPNLSATIMQREGSVGQIALPLLASNLLVGAVLMDVNDEAVFTALDFLKEIAEIAAQAIGNAILFGRSEYERERIGTLYQSSLALSGSSLKSAEILQIAADTSLILANTPHCALLSLDEKSRILSIRAVKGVEGNSLGDFDLSLDKTIHGKALLSGRTQYLSDATAQQRSLPRSTNGSLFGSVLAIPILHKQQVLGIFMLFSVDLRAFHREQIQLLESLASQVAAALNAALTHESATNQTVQDAHTGLYNHRHFSETLVKELDRSARHKHELAILRVDIDHLSRVNELLGAAKGDEAIQHVAQVLKAALRDIDIPCRYGSQEFALILPETPRQMALEVAERLRSRIRSQAAPGVGMVTVSIGLATYPENGNDCQSLLKAAEQALDVAKFEGRDRVKMAESGMNLGGPISWDELAAQAKLAIVSERQSKLQSRLGMAKEYAPWMRAVPNWGKLRKEAQ